MSNQPLKVLPVQLTKGTYLIGGEPIVIGAHYPITEVQKKDGYAYVKDPICPGPLKLMSTYIGNSGIDFTAVCPTCGLVIESSHTAFKSKADWYNALNRWLIAKVETISSDVSCARASICINHTIEPQSPLLDLPPVMLLLMRSDELPKHALVAYGMTLRRILKTTRNASRDVKHILGF